MLTHFGLNRSGRDFVVGDLHGYFDHLTTALKRVEFNPSQDRCFSVGDLIDRGPQSNQVLQWLKKPWFHACIGNHEEMILNFEVSSKRGNEWFSKNGGEWWLALDDDTRRQHRRAFEKLPIAMEIETPDGTVGIVHADVPSAMSWPRFTRLLALGDTNCRDEALWGRRRARGRIKKAVKAIDRVVCGHTITVDRKIQVVANTWFIDTGICLDEPESTLTLLPLSALFKKP